jgi:hypothetical protein
MIVINLSDSVLLYGKMIMNNELEWCGSGDGLNGGIIPVHGWKN